MVVGSVDSGRGPERWRGAVWGTAAILWVVVMVMIQVIAGLNVAQTVAVSFILFTPAGIYELALALRTRDAAYRAAVVIALGAGFLLLWVNGAVGIIGNEDNTANLMYVGVLAIGGIGALIARFRPRGMARAAFATAVAQASVPAIALIAWPPQTTSWGGAGVGGVFILSWFFVFLFVGSAWLFRIAADGRPEDGPVPGFSPLQDA